MTNSQTNTDDEAINVINKFKIETYDSTKLIEAFKYYATQQTTLAVEEKQREIDEMVKETFSACPYYHKWLESQSSLTTQSKEIDFWKDLKQQEEKRSCKYADMAASSIRACDTLQSQLSEVTKERDILIRCINDTDETPSGQVDKEERKED